MSAREQPVSRTDAGDDHLDCPVDATPAPLGNGLLLPLGSRLVHIGAPKTGSTAIQVALAEARPALAEHGVHYPGRGSRPRKAGWALGLPGRPAGTPVPHIRHWRNLVREVKRFDGTDTRVCISDEDFGRADPVTARRIVEDLGGDRVHVVAAVRRLDNYLASQWQQRVRAGETRRYEGWLKVVLGDNPDAWAYRNVWGAHDVAALVERWTAIVGTERFTLIVSDDRDPELLPRTFEGLLGLPRHTLKLIPSRSNRGLSWAEVELVRSVNKAAIQRGWSRAERRTYITAPILRAISDHPAPLAKQRPPLPTWAASRLRDLSNERADTVAAMPVQVVGDPASLRMPSSEASVGELRQLSPPTTVETALASALIREVVTTALEENGRLSQELSSALARPEADVEPIATVPEPSGPRSSRRSLRSLRSWATAARSRL